MGFEFAETMSGTMELDASPGTKHPFTFDLVARASSTRDHMRTGRVEVRGVIKAPPLAGSADVEGTMLIRPLGQRIIRYELAFLADDGQRFEVVGQKDIKLRKLVESWTVLSLEVLDEEHRRVATCLTRFDYRNDWWSFMRSFRPA